MRLSTTGALLLLASCGRGLAAPSRRWAYPDNLLGGCGKSLPSGQTNGGTYNVSISSSGIDRTYLVFVPPHYNPWLPTPLILSYHGGNRNATQQLQLDLLTEPQFNTVSMVVYPQGQSNSWEGVPGDTSPDLQFTTDIIDRLQSQYCIDPTRIGATGKSDGAGFVNLLACDSTLSNRIAAFAPVSGAYYVDTLPCYPSTVDLPCSPGRSDIPMLAFHGGNDTTIAYLGGERKNECLPTIPHFIQSWAARDGLAEPQNKTIPVAADTVLYQFGDASWTTTGLVGLYYESNIGHDWPSTEPNSDNQASGHHVANYNATPRVLDFFASHPLPVQFLF